MENQLPKFAKPNVACRVVARAVDVASLKCPPSLKLRPDSLRSAAALRVKTGGKGIIYKRFFSKARPEEDFRYFSNLRARSLSENAI
jgi:hypothetical protein